MGDIYSDYDEKIYSKRDISNILNEIRSSLLADARMFGNNGKDYPWDIAIDQQSCDFEMIRYKLGIEF